MEKMILTEEGTFEWALSALKCGKTVRRKCWNESCMELINDKWLLVFHGNKSPEVLSTLAICGIMATDWEIVYGAE